MLREEFYSFEAELKRFASSLEESFTSSWRLLGLTASFLTKAAKRLSYPFLATPKLFRKSAPGRSEEFDKGAPPSGFALHQHPPSKFF